MTNTLADNTSGIAILLSLIFGYLAGSIPFGLLFTQYTGAGDLRSIGSGNIGATNVLRTGRKDLAIATLLFDAFKGFAPVIMCSYWGSGTAMAAALGAVVGHVFPVWLKFEGGKGVATFFGALIALNVGAAFIFAVVWIAVVYTTGYSSAAALVATAIAPIAMYAMGRPEYVALIIVLGALLYWRHRENIERLKAGTETKIETGV